MALNLTIKQLRYAETAGRLGSIAAAAGEHNISQSSITAAIDAMEAALGFDLFTPPACQRHHADTFRFGGVKDDR